MFGLGIREIIIIAVVAVLLFGSRKIPELAKSLVDTIKHLRTAFDDDDKKEISSSDKNSKKK